jgi:hypothetical protein
MASAVIGCPTAMAAGSDEGARPMDLGRFIVAQLTSAPPAAIHAQFSFQVLISVPAADWDAARASMPAYRDIVLRTAYGYVAFALRNGVGSSPERLAHLIATRMGDEPNVPAPVFVTLPNFQEVRPSAPDGALRGPR